MTIVGGLIQNGALLLALVLAYSLFIERFPRGHTWTQLVHGALFGITALIGMVYPVQLSAGVFFDARTVVVGMAGLFGGLITAAVATLIASSYRAWVGGAGAFMGVATIWTAAALGLGLRSLHRRGRVEINALTLGIFGFVVHLGALAWIITLPTAVRSEVLSHIALPYLAIFPAVSLLLGLLLQMQEQRYANERSLRLSQARLLEAKRLAGLGNWEWDLETDTHHWSPELYQLFGRDPSLPPASFPEVGMYFSNESWQQLAATVRRTIDDGRSFQQEVEVIRPDGTRRWAVVRTETVLAQSGQVTALRGTIQDVTDRRQLAERLEKIAAHIPGVIYQYQQWPDGRGAFPYASAGIRDIYGVDAASVVADATQVFESLHPDDIEAITRSIAESMRNLTTWHQTYRIRLPEGRIIWVEGEASPEQQPDGSVLWHGYIRDITAQAQADAQLRLAASVFAHSLEGIIITDADNRILDVNPSFSRITGYRKDEVIGQDPKILASGHHDESFFSRMWETLGEQGSWHGETWNRRKDGTVFAAMLSISLVHDRSGRIRNHIGVFSDISEAKAHEAELDRIAHYDPLTGIPNRRLLTDRLEQAIAHARRSGKAVAVCYLDLDGFKAINDEHGHNVGDEFLIKATEALRQVLRAEDTIARLGGDEFVLLLPEVVKPDDCYGLLNRTLSAIRQPIRAGDAVHQVSASIGVTLSPPDRPDPDILLRHADQAMYLAKDSGKNQFHLYDAEQDQLLQARRKKLELLNNSLDQDALVLHFQPQVDLISREVIRLEALVRWQHPTQGLLAPDTFLPDIAGTEVEIAVGKKVLETALRIYQQWLERGHRLAISVNVGAHQLLQPDFLDYLRRLLARFPLVAGADLELEILETAALSDFERAERTLSECKALGLRLALDDFGTGYSSLAYFRALPLQVLKIDRSFVRDMLADPSDLEIVESVVKLSHAFDRAVIAEGVETMEHAAVLTWLGCRYGQGYGIARPMPAAEVLDWIERWNAQVGWGQVTDAQDRPELPLLIAAQNHRYWLHHFNQALAQGGGAQLARLQTDPGELAQWLGGDETARWRSMPEFEAVNESHDRLQRVERRLRSDLEARFDAAASDDAGRWSDSSVRELRTASDRWLSDLARLVDRISAQARQG